MQVHRQASQIGQAFAVFHPDAFPSVHEHIVRRGEVFTTRTPDYRESGYPDEHNHVLQDLVSPVKSIQVETGGTEFVGGAGSSIYRTKDFGETWEEFLDVNDVNENADDASSVSFLGLS